MDQGVENDLISNKMKADFKTNLKHLPFLYLFIFNFPFLLILNKINIIK